MLESARKRTRPRQANLYDVFCAILYLLKSGCQWSMLPCDFPAKSTVYHYFTLWKAKPSFTLWKAKPSHDTPGLLEQALKKCGWLGPYETGAQRHYPFLIVDAQSVKNSDTAGQNGYDAGKKVSGIKRAILPWIRRACPLPLR